MNAVLNSLWFLWELRVSVLRTSQSNAHPTAPADIVNERMRMAGRIRTAEEVRTVVKRLMETHIGEYYLPI
jgi:hypothetical protein